MSGFAYSKARTSGILPGASPKDPLTVDAKTLDFFDKQQKLIYSGDVYVVNGPSKLNASRLIIFLEDKKPTGNKSEPIDTSTNSIEEQNNRILSDQSNNMNTNLLYMYNGKVYKTEAAMKRAKTNANKKKNKKN